MRITKYGYAGIAKLLFSHTEHLTAIIAERRSYGMIMTDGYSIWYEKNANRIVISLPQTMETVTNTMTLPTNRKTDFTDHELCLILFAAKAIAERKWNSNDRP